MTYEKKHGDYKEERNLKAKYHPGETLPSNETNSSSSIPSFQETFRDIPKGGSIAAMPEYHNGVIYFPSIDSHVYAVDAISGGLIWRFKTGAPAVSTPLIHNNRVYFGSNDEHFYCVDLLGKLIWKKHLGDVIVSYPTGIGNKILIAAGKILFCLSEQGEEVWRFMTGDGMVVIPSVVNDTIFIGSYDKNVYAIGMNGKLKWKIITGGIVGSPLIFSENKVLFTSYKRSWKEAPKAKNPVLYFPSADNNLYAVDDNGNVIWKFNRGSSFVISVGGDNGIVYVGSVSGYLYAIDALSGQEKWNFRTGGLITSGVVVHDEKVFLTSWDQKIYCLSESGEKVWDFLTGGPIAADPLVIGNRVYFGSDDSFLYCLNIEKRTVEWTFRCGFGLPNAMQNKIKQLMNAFTEYDKKIFKVWVPETRKGSTKQPVMENYQFPKGFEFGGQQVYKSTHQSYANKRPYKKDWNYS